MSQYRTWTYHKCDYLNLEKNRLSPEFHLAQQARQNRSRFKRADLLQDQKHAINSQAGERAPFLQRLPGETWNKFTGTVKVKIIKANYCLLISYELCILSSSKSSPGTAYHFHPNVRATSQHTYERSSGRYAVSWLKHSRESIRTLTGPVLFIIVFILLLLLLLLLQYSFISYEGKEHTKTSQYMATYYWEKSSQPLRLASLSHISCHTGEIDMAMLSSQMWWNGGGNRMTEMEINDLHWLHYGYFPLTTQLRQNW